MPQSPGSRIAWTAGCVLAAALFAVADARWGARYSLRLLVFLPVLAAAVRGGPAAPVAAGFVGAISWGAALRGNTHDAPPDGEIAWEAVTRFVMWVLPAVALGRSRRAVQRERLQAGIDPLTGLSNRRGLLEQLPAVLDECVEGGRPMTIAYLDADGFKAVNDTFGHSRGDAVLIAAARTFRANTRRGDLLGRMGGDEFVLVLPDMTAEAARGFLGRVQIALRAAMNAVPAEVTFCAGAATFASPTGDPDALLQTADRLMYEAKSAGPGETRFAAV